jgi:choline-sulfatase
MLTRRSFLATSSAATLSASPVRPRHPNVLFLISDQHQRAASGIYGHSEVKTPNVDAIGAQSTRFNRAYCQSPVCVPARGSLITGVYPHRHGAKILDDPLPEDARTIAHFFREQGYVTGAIGKMHFVDESLKHGFNYRLHEGDFLATLSGDDRRRLRQDHGTADAVEGRASGLEPRFFQDNYFADKTVEFLRQNRSRPFLLFSSVILPHTPLTPHRDFFDLYRDRTLTLPKRSESELQSGFEGNLIRARERNWYQQSDQALAQSLRGYYGNVSQADSYIGRVYKALHDLGLEQDTIVVYTSDHGEMAGAHRMWTKHNMYEQSVGVPLLISFPGRVPTNAQRNELTEQVDLLPTVAELAGFVPPREVQGRSVAPLLTGKRYTPREFAYSEYYFCRRVFTKDDRYVGKPPMLMVRTDKYKLNYLSWARCELYDLEQDPGEFKNRIDDPNFRSIAKELERAAIRMLNS